MKKIINTLCEASVVVKTSVENWMLCGVTSHELERAASFMSECNSVVVKLKEAAISVSRSVTISVSSSANKNRPKSKPISARALHRHMSDLEFLRLRRFFNLYATYEFQEHVPSNKELRQVTSSFFARDARQLPSSTTSGPQDGVNSLHERYSSDTQISYIRVDKTLCKSFIIGRPDRH